MRVMSVLVVFALLDGREFLGQKLEISFVNKNIIRFCDIKVKV